MIPKEGKDPTIVTSYKPIGLLSSLSKLFEKRLLSTPQKYSYLEEKMALRLAYLGG